MRFAEWIVILVLLGFATNDILSRNIRLQRDTNSGPEEVHRKADTTHTIDNPTTLKPTIATTVSDKPTTQHVPSTKPTDPLTTPQTTSMKPTPPTTTEPATTEVTTTEPTTTTSTTESTTPTTTTTTTTPTTTTPILTTTEDTPTQALTDAPTSESTTEEPTETPTVPQGSDSLSSTTDSAVNPTKPSDSGEKAIPGCEHADKLCEGGEVRPLMNLSNCNRISGTLYFGEASENIGDDLKSSLKCITWIIGQLKFENISSTKNIDVLSNLKIIDQRGTEPALIVKNVRAKSIDLSSLKTIVSKGLLSADIDRMEIVNASENLKILWTNQLAQSLRYKEKEEQEKKNEETYDLFKFVIIALCIFLTVLIFASTIACVMIYSIHKGNKRRRHKPPSKLKYRRRRSDGESRTPTQSTLTDGTEMTEDAMSRSKTTKTTKEKEKEKEKGKEKGKKGSKAEKKKEKTGKKTKGSERKKKSKSKSTKKENKESSSKKVGAESPGYFDVPQQGNKEWM